MAMLDVKEDYQKSGKNPIVSHVLDNSPLELR